MINMFMKKGFLETEEIRDLDQIKEIKEYAGIMSENWAKVDTLVNFQITYNFFRDYITTVGAKHHSHFCTQIYTAVRAVDNEDTLDVAILRHAAKHYYDCRKHTETKETRIRKFENCTDHISTDLKLKKAMVTHHVSYCELFDEVIDREPNLDTVAVEVFEKVLFVE